MTTRIQILREEQGLSRTELAIKAKISSSKLRGFEVDHYELYISEATQIADALGVRSNAIVVVRRDGCFPREKSRPR